MYMIILNITMTGQKNFDTEINKSLKLTHNLTITVPDTGLKMNRILTFYRRMEPFHRKFSAFRSNLTNLDPVKATSPQTRSGGTGFTDMMLFRRRCWQHLLFWAVVTVILLNIFRTSGSIGKIDVIYTLLFMIPIVSMAYLNLYVAIPAFLRKEKYLIYICTLLLLSGAGAFWLYVLFDRWIDFLLPGYYFIAYYTIPELMIFSGSLLLLTTLIKLSRSWFLMLRVERLTAGQQLKVLQSQINPHFLLNSLQTLYALSLERSGRTPEAILQLSDILKYTLYETDQQRVKLRNEIDMIRDYVEMYRYRIDPERVRLLLDIRGDPGEEEIAPMLLIPFVENAFKHGLKMDQAPVDISIALTMEPGQLTFSVENSAAPAIKGKERGEKGIGIENTRHRLELLYPGNHHLMIRREQDRFRIELQLKL